MASSAGVQSCLKTLSEFKKKKDRINNSILIWHGWCILHGFINSETSTKMN